MRILFTLLIALLVGNATAQNPNFSADSGTQIGSGWHGNILGGSGGVLYLVPSDGALNWYRATGLGTESVDGDVTESWASGEGSAVGTGWNVIYVLGGYDGRIYAVTEENNGNLLWYQRTSDDGTESWDERSGTVVGRGGWRMSQVFGGGNGLIFAIENGDLFYYRHLGNPDQGIDGWAPRSGEVIGRGWDRFDLLASASDGAIVARERDTGDLFYYLWDESTWSWAKEYIRIGHGWGEFTGLVLGPNGYLYARRSDGALLYYEIADTQNLDPVTVSTPQESQRACIIRTWKPDGCSTPSEVSSVLGSTYNTRFKNACDQHDICYATAGQTKASCDVQFKSDMDRICGLDLTCRDIATLYAGAVLVGGQSSYDDAAPTRTRCAR